MMNEIKTPWTDGPLDESAASWWSRATTEEREAVLLTLNHAPSIARELSLDPDMTRGISSTTSMIALFHIAIGVRPIQGR